MYALLPPPIVPRDYRPRADGTPPDERDRAKFEDLHRAIRACDDVLNSVETNLTSFRNDLALVSADIETLQARSTALNVRLENRRVVERGLGPVVDELSVSPAVVSKIADGHIDEQWVQVLKEVDRRAAAYADNSASQRRSKAVADLGRCWRSWCRRCGSPPPLLSLPSLPLSLSFKERADLGAG